MRSLVLSLLIALFGGTTLATTAQGEAISLEPSSSWVVDYAEDSCKLIRQFGTDDDIVVAIFNRFAPGDGFQLTLAGKPVAVRSRARNPASLRFGPTEAEQEQRFAIGEMPDGKPALIFSHWMRIAPLTESEKKENPDTEPQLYSLNPISDERKAAVTELTIARSLSKPVVLKLGAMDKPFAALTACHEELLTHWGIDVEKHRNLAVPARPDPDLSNWFSFNDFPPSLRFGWTAGIVHFRLNVDEAGNPTACHIQQSSRAQAFDDFVCNSVMKRAKFLPALDKDGKPIASYYRNSVLLNVR